MSASDMLFDLGGVGSSDIETLKPVEEGEQIDDVITYLLRQGADVNSLDDYNQSPLHYAAKKGGYSHYRGKLKTAILGERNLKSRHIIIIFSN